MMDNERERREALLHPTVQAPVEQPSWLLGIVDHIVTMNHELGGIQKDMGWIKAVLRILIVLVIALVIIHGPDLWMWVLELVT